MMAEKEVEVSVMIPCLNSENTVGICVKKALKVFNDLNIRGEVVVVDNASDDNSAEVAKKAGAKVVHWPKRGYGSACLKGLAEVRGKYIIMGDDDDTYDFLEIPKFLKYLRTEEYDMVLGTRLKGDMVPGAMSFLHKIGNYILTLIFLIFFSLKISDLTSGYRAFTHDCLNKMELKTIGMEFSTEMLIKTAKLKFRVKEIPISYHPRKNTKSGLRTFHDGYRIFRLLLLFAPNWLFLIPGVLFLAIGLFLIFAILNGPLVIGSMEFDLHPMIFGAFLLILGLQIIIFGLQSKIYSKSIGLGNESKTLKFIDEYFTLEKGTLIGFAIFFIGFAILIYIFNTWLGVGFVQQIKLMLAGMTLTVLGIQIIFSSWFLSMIGIEKR